MFRQLSIKILPRMRRKLSYFSSVLSFGLFLISLNLGAAELRTLKGPFLHFSKENLQVRFQPSSPLVKPVLESRKQGATTSQKVPLQAEDLKFWKADLSPETGEYRIVDGDNSTSWIPVSTPTKPKFPFVFVVYGDNRTGGGDSNVHKEVLSNIAKELPAFVIHTGDLTANGSSESYWNQFYQEGKALFASVPFQPAIGNHDLSPQRLFAYFFNLGDKYNTYYYFHYGRALFIALDTTLDFGPDSDQYKFLKDNLEKFKGDSPVVIYFHHPPFSFSKHGSDAKVKAILVPLFEKYGVDLVINGHEHGYQRFGPINGVTYIVSGGGGAPLYQINSNPELKAFKSVHHYVVFRVDDTTISGTMKESYDKIGDNFETVYSQTPVKAENGKARDLNSAPKKTKKTRNLVTPP